jgi:hypothetical protein
MKAIVADLERELLPPFKELAESVPAQFPGVKADVKSQSYDSPADFHHIYISCLLPDVPHYRPDLVELIVGLYDLSSSPKINADVCWGHPSGYVEAEFSFDPVEASAKVLNELYADLPRLYESFIEAVKRGRPSNWDERHA